MLKSDSKPFNYKNYLLPRINRETLRKELQILLEIGVLNMVFQYQYGITIFIMPKKEGTMILIMEYCRLNQELV